MTTHELRHRFTGTVGRCSIIIGTHISTRIGEGSCALTITTTKHVVDDVTTEDGDIRSWYSSSITTTIHIFDAGQLTSLDNYLGTGLILGILIFAQRVCRDIVSLVTTAIDGSYIVGIRLQTTSLVAGLCQSSFRRLVCTNRTLHPDLHMSLRCTVQVVGTENLARQWHAVITCTRECAVQLCTVKDYLDITAHIGRDSRFHRFERCLLAQTATIDITFDKTFKEIDMCVFGIIEDKVTGRLTGVHTTQCTTAIDMAVHGSTARGLPLATDIHFHIAFHKRRLTIATTKYNIRDGVAACRHRTHRTTGNRHRGIGFHHTVLIGTAIDGCLHVGVGIGTIFNSHRGITKVLCHDILGIIFIVMTQATTEYTTVHGTFINVNRRCLIIFAGGIRGCIYRAQSRSTIDVVLHETRSRVGIRSLCVGSSTEVHDYFAADHCCSTLTATIDITVRITGIRGITDGTASYRYHRIFNHVGRITATEDVQHTIGTCSLDSHLRIMVHCRHIAATEHTTAGFCDSIVAFTVLNHLTIIVVFKYLTFNYRTPLNGQHGIAHLTQLVQIDIGIDIMLTIAVFDTCCTIRRHLIHVFPFVVRRAREHTLLEHTRRTVVFWILSEASIANGHLLTRS